MSVYVKKNDVMDILFESIDFPEVDESDQALVNYELAKVKIMALPEVSISDEETE